MKAKTVYSKLERDFDLKNCTDNWREMDFNSFISENFKRRYIGVVLDNSEEIKYVFTAVFPTYEILDYILKSGKTNALLFTHHPMVFDITKSKVFNDMNPKLLAKLKERKISMYTLHAPLDHNSDYSTTVNYAKALGIIKTSEFFEYYGKFMGIIGKTKFKTVSELAHKVEQTVGHKVRIFNYGSEKIKDQKVSLITGGGNDIRALKDIKKMGTNTHLVGICVNNNYSKEAHETAKKYKINLIGATHYSTEKFALIAMVDYFKKQGLPAEFIEGKPGLADLGADK